MRPTRLAQTLVLFSLPFACTAPAEQAMDETGFRSAVESHADPKRLAQSSIGVVIKHYGTIPENPSQWRTALSLAGSLVNEFLVPFSRAPGETHLTQPRLLMNVQPKHEKPVQTLPGGRGDGVGTRGSGLYLGFIYRANAQAPEVEFISFNRQRQAFDFGVIKNMGLANARVEFVTKEATCTGCHFAQAPIFPEIDWANTTSNPTVFRAMVKRLAETDPTTYGALEVAVASIVAGPPAERANKLISDPIVKAATFLGAKLLPRAFGFAQSAPITNFDLSSVRNEPFFLRVHQYIARLAKPTVREAVVETIIKLYFRQHAGGPGELGRQALVDKFSEDDLRPCGLLPGQMPVTLQNFNPVNGETGITPRDIDPAAVDATLAYDVARRAGQAPVPPGAAPSNIDAYTNGVAIFDTSFRIREDALEAIGMINKDAKFMLDPYRAQLIKLPFAQRAAALTAALFNEPGPSSPYATPGALNSAAVKALYKRGMLPPREELMAAVYSGLDAFCEAHFDFKVGVPRSYYSHPGITPIDFAQEPEQGGVCDAVATQTPCGGCHFAGTQNALKFDAADATLWDTKLAANPIAPQDKNMLVKSIVRVSIDIDKDMPPSTSIEIKTFKDPERKALTRMLCLKLSVAAKDDPPLKAKFDDYCAGVDIGGSTSTGDTSGSISTGSESTTDGNSGGAASSSSGDSSGHNSGDTSTGDTSGGSSGSSTSDGDSSGSSTSGGSTSSGDSSGDSSGGSTSGDSTSGGSTSGGSTSGSSTSGGSTSGSSTDSGSSGGTSAGGTTSASDGTGESGSTSGGTGDSSTGTDADTLSTSDGESTTGGDDDDGPCASYCGSDSEACTDNCCPVPGACDEDEYAVCYGMCEWCSAYVCDSDDEDPPGDESSGGSTSSSDSVGDATSDDSVGVETSASPADLGGPPDPEEVPDTPILFNPYWDTLAL